MTEPIVLFQRAADGFGRHVHAVGDGQWHDPTPDTEWDVRMLVNHVTVEQLWVPPLVQGATVADIGESLDGDQLGADPVASWDAAVNASRAAFGAPGALDGTVSLSAGAKPTAEYCWEMTTDALIHSWDLAARSAPTRRSTPSSRSWCTNGRSRSPSTCRRPACSRPRFRCPTMLRCRRSCSPSSAAQLAEAPVRGRSQAGQDAAPSASISLASAGRRNPASIAARVARPNSSTYCSRPRG